MDSPISFPTIDINGERCEVRFDNRTLYRLEKAGNSLAVLAEKLKGGSLNYAIILDLASAAIQSKTRARGFLPEELADFFAPKDIAPLATVVFEAMGKVKPVALKEPAADPANQDKLAN